MRLPCFVNGFVDAKEPVVIILSTNEGFGGCFMYRDMAFLTLDVLLMVGEVEDSTRGSVLLSEMESLIVIICLEECELPRFCLKLAESTDLLGGTSAFCVILL
ncbi:hypothetical protein L484_008321 [Morus notabilis]|uniref:Uncharacterized protein n=1 Tax=Morus notabilis TaxID=981085 RepID=W9RAZ4_9ROSA|nr:hypothetical protein L484_008321 [Morus notabilis]